MNGVELNRGCIVKLYIWVVSVFTLDDGSQPVGMVVLSNLFDFVSDLPHMT